MKQRRNPFTQGIYVRNASINDLKKKNQNSKTISCSNNTIPIYLHNLCKTGFRGCCGRWTEHSVVTLFHSAVVIFLFFVIFFFSLQQANDSYFHVVSIEHTIYSYLMAHIIIYYIFCSFFFLLQSQQKKNTPGIKVQAKQSTAKKTTTEQY